MVNVLYFGLVLLFSMCLMHPACLVASLVGGGVYSVRLRGKKATRFGLALVLPMAVAAAVINPLFSHEGATILAYLPSGNPLTLESIVYGVLAALMLACVMLWFSCFNEVMRSDKLVYLFGRVAPALSLTLSMALRFVPLFASQVRLVADAQRAQGRDMRAKSLWKRARNGFAVLSIVITWSLENAIETADSMKSRGYGLPGRTAFSIYRFGQRDRALLGWLLFCAGYLLSGWMAGGLFFRCFPTIKSGPVGPFSVSFLLVYLALCLTPTALDLAKGAAWRARKGGSDRCAGGRTEDKTCSV